MTQEQVVRILAESLVRLVEHSSKRVGPIGLKEQRSVWNILARLPNHFLPPSEFQLDIINVVGI